MDVELFGFPTMSMRNGLALLLALLMFTYAVINAAALQVTPIECWFVLSLMAASALALGLLTLRPATSIAIISALFVALQYAAEAKFKELQDPLLVTDFLYFSSFGIVDTLRHYPDVALVGKYIVPPVLLAFALLYIADFRPWRSLRWPVRRLLQLSGFALALLLVILLDSGHGPFASVVRKDLWSSLSDESYLTNLFVSIPNSSIELPTFEGAADTTDSWKTAPDEPALPEEKPDIFMVLEESTFDPRTVALCSTDICKIPGFFDADSRTVASGPMIVHTFGGATYTSEFASLTGLPHTLFGAAGRYAPYKLAPLMQHTLPDRLRELGYRSVAIYPMYADFLNARNAYINYGFDAFHDSVELGLDWGTPDSVVFAAMDRVLKEERKYGKPLFVSVLTMNQHGPHSHPLSTLPTPWSAGLFPDQSAAINTAMTTYLYRLHDSAKAMRSLETQLLDRPEPTVLLHFGDHEPSFDGLLLTLQRTPPESASLQWTRTYYMVKSNLDADAQASKPLVDARVLDIAYLPGLLLQAAGLPPGPYFDAQIALRKSCAGLFTDCPDKRLLDRYYDHVFNHLDVMSSH